MKGLIIIGSAQVGSHTNALSKYLKGQLGEQTHSSIGFCWYNTSS